MKSFLVALLVLGVSQSFALGLKSGETFDGTGSDLGAKCTLEVVEVLRDGYVLNVKIGSKSIQRAEFKSLIKNFEKNGRKLEILKGPFHDPKGKFTTGWSTQLEEDMKTQMPSRLEISYFEGTVGVKLLSNVACTSFKLKR